MKKVETCRCHNCIYIMKVVLDCKIIHILLIIEHNGDASPENIVLNVHVPSEEKSDYSKDSFYEELQQVFYIFSKCHMKILLEDFNAKVVRDNLFKPTVGSESLHQNSNDNGVRIVNFATSKNLVIKSTMFLHRNIHKYTWTSPDGKTHNQITY